MYNYVLGSLLHRLGRGRGDEGVRLMLVVLQGHAVPRNECERFQLGGQTDAMLITMEFVGILKFPWTMQRSASIVMMFLLRIIIIFMVAGITVRRFRNRVRIVVPNCADIDLVMWVSCLNSTFWSRASTIVRMRSSSTLHCLLWLLFWLRIVVMHYPIISLPTLYTQWRVVYRCIVHWNWKLPKVTPLTTIGHLPVGLL